jgi:hypothetical protein
MQASLAIMGGLFGLVAFLSTLDWRWLLGAVVLLQIGLTIFVIMPINRRLMDMLPEAATARAAALSVERSSCRSKCSASWQLIFCGLSGEVGGGPPRLARVSGCSLNG